MESMKMFQKAADEGHVSAMVREPHIDIHFAYLFR